MWGFQVIIPPRGHKVVLQELHEGYLGMTKTKSLARMYVWWPGIDKAMEKSVQECCHCQMEQSNPQAAPLQPWKRPHGHGCGYIWTSWDPWRGKRF